MTQAHRGERRDATARPSHGRRVPSSTGFDEGWDRDAPTWPQIVTLDRSDVMTGDEHTPLPGGRSTSRRRFLATGAAGAAGLAGAGLLAGCRRTVDAALRADPAGTGSLADIDHIVLLMQENRSFDHYFGSMSGVRGFDDPSARLTQVGYSATRHLPDPSGRLQPYPFSVPGRDNTDVLFDPDHSWDVQHASWNHGRMDGWLRAHLAADGPVQGAQTMGYYTRADLPTHYALADAFTVCDHYFSSVMGPTAPNRMYWMTATMDPGALGGGPILAHSHRIPRFSLQWPTFPEVLTDAGVSWKVYNARGPASSSELSGMLKYFAAYRDPASELYGRGIAPRLRDFRADVATGKLPSVSWIVPSYADSEHPSYPPAIGARSIVDVLDVLASNPAVWERTLLVVSYDESGGFFDHVAPPTPPAGTPGEFVVDAVRHGVAPDAPIGLGFRVPALLISPYTRGGRVFSDVADHTSQLKLIARRFGLPVPNLTNWRDRTVSDLAAAVQPAAGHRPLPRMSSGDISAADEAAADVRETFHAPSGKAPASVVTSDRRPVQARSPQRTRVPPQQ